MRPRIAMGLLAIGLLLAGALLLLRTGNSPPADAKAVAAEEPAPQVDTNPPPKAAKKSKPATNVTATNEDSVSPESAAARQETYVKERVGELQDLATHDDAASLNTILSELSNREPEIRKAAVEASIQFGSRDAIPRLQEAILQTDDPHEKAALADAVEFLKLPSLSESLHQSGQAASPSASPGQK